MKRVWILLTIILGLLLIGCSNSPLTANAGEDFEISVGDTPTFDGCASTGNIDNYRWTIVEAPEAMAGDVGKIIREVDVNCSFTLDASMGLDEVGEWGIQLEVSNSAGERDTDQVTVTVNE
ncbi:MAG: hypothetical protein WAM60_23450 [Candidatus Promineifilaceae bacterium]